MNNLKVFSRSGTIMLVLLLLVLPASAWTFSDWSGPSNGVELQPGSTVRAGYTMSFSSFDTGKTFDPDNSLVMYTDLSNPHWVVVMTEEVNDAPVTTPLADRQSAQVRLDGWGLSFSRKQFNIDVALTGTVPALNESEGITVLRLQELDPGVKTVPGTLTKKTALVVVPTPEPAVVPATAQEETVIEVTPVPVQTAITPSPPVTPVKKQTYAPGPDALTVCGMLAGVIFFAGYFRRQH